MRTALTNKGFTLIELLVAIVVSSVLMAGIYSIFIAQLNVSTIQDQTSTVQQNLRSAMYLMEREIRMAGYQGNIASGDAGAGFGTATAATMAFSYVKDDDGIDNDGNGNTDETGELTQIQYTFAGSVLSRAVDAQPTRPIAENIEKVEFLYNQGLATQDTDPANLAVIETVTISILARSAVAVPGKETGRLYTTPSGDTWGNKVATGTDPDTEDYDDGFYRRYITSRIVCRNLTSN